MSESITINLSTVAQTAGIKAIVEGLAQVREGAHASAEALKETVTRAAEIALAALGVESFFGAVREAITEADQLGKAAQSAGMSVQDFSTIVRATTIGSDQMVLAMKGLSHWLEATGQSGRDLKEVFMEQADLFSRIEDGEEKVTLGTQRFGRGYRDLIPFLNLGSEGMRRQIETVTALGGAIGPEFAKQSFAFDQNIKNVKVFIGGVFDGIAETLAPGLLAASDSVVKWLVANSQKIIGFFKDAVSLIVESFKDGTLGELVSLLIEAGVSDGFDLGMKAAKWTVEHTLLTVDFLTFAANAGKALATALLGAVRPAVDFLSASLETAIDKLYNAVTKQLNDKGGFIGVIDSWLRKFAEWNNKLVSEANARDGTKTPLIDMALVPGPHAKPESQRQPLVPDSFSDNFLKAQEASRAAIDDMVAKMRAEIEKTTSALGKGTPEDPNKHVEPEDRAEETKLSSAMQRINELMARRAEIRKEDEEASAAAAEAESSKAATEETVSLSRIENRKKEIELETQVLALANERLKTRGMELDASGALVGSLQQEKEAIEANLAKMKQIATERKGLDDKLAGTGLTDPHTQRANEIKDQGELLKIERERVALKDKLNDFSFMQRLTNNLQDMADKFKNLGSAIADTLTNGIKSAIDTVSKGLWQVIDGTATWGDLFRQVGRQIISSLIEVAIQHFVVDSIVRAIKTAYLSFHTASTAAEAAVSASGDAAQVASHTTAEAAKTGATTGGSFARGAVRVGETIFHGIMVVARTAAHIAGEVAMTAATLLQAAIRMPVTILEAGKDLVVAAFKAASAVADIPYVGPILAIAAMAAIIGAGVKYMGGFESGGVVRGPQQVIRVNESGTESVLNARATAALGEDVINAMNSGYFDLESRTASNMPAMSSLYGSPQSGQGGPGSRGGQGGYGLQSSGQPGSVNIILVDSRNSQAAKDFVMSSAGRVAIAEVVRDQKTEVGIR